ncbi:hypothetical protein BDR05DRAFT_672986 [Suillus weaverae]|nr:hypothetical protein BDR05DRAFT_672986 [Suillus weaverae]
MIGPPANLHVTKPIAHLGRLNSYEGSIDTSKLVSSTVAYSTLSGLDSTCRSWHVLTLALNVEPSDILDVIELFLDDNAAGEKLQGMVQINAATLSLMPPSRHTYGVRLEQSMTQMASQKILLDS